MRSKSNDYPFGMDDKFSGDMGQRSNNYPLAMDDKTIM
jgi:hypothetical protein